MAAEAAFDLPELKKDNSTGLRRDTPSRPGCFLEPINSWAQSSIRFFEDQDNIIGQKHQGYSNPLCLPLASSDIQPGAVAIFLDIDGVFNAVQAEERPHWPPNLEPSCIHLIQGLSSRWKARLMLSNAWHSKRDECILILRQAGLDIHDTMVNFEGTYNRAREISDWLLFNRVSAWVALWGADLERGQQRTADSPNSEYTSEIQASKVMSGHFIHTNRTDHGITSQDLERANVLIEKQMRVAIQVSEDEQLTVIFLDSETILSSSLNHERKIATKECLGAFSTSHKRRLNSSKRIQVGPVRVILLHGVTPAREVELRRILDDVELRLYGELQGTGPSSRADDIINWVLHNKVDAWVVLDSIDLLNGQASGSLQMDIQGCSAMECFFVHLSNDYLTPEDVSLANELLHLQIF